MQLVKREGIDVPLLDDMRKEMDGLLESVISQKVKERADLLEKYVLELAVPKIKGEITPEKLRWRGIKIKVKYDGGHQVWQRNEAISPIIHITFPTV